MQLLAEWDIVVILSFAIQGSWISTKSILDLNADSRIEYIAFNILPLLCCNIDILEDCDYTTISSLDLYQLAVQKYYLS